jgi:hypothetical protein
MSIRAGQQRPASRPEIWLALLFGCCTLGAVLWLAFRSGPPLTDQQFEILRSLLALAGGGVGAVIPGFLDVNLTAGTKLVLRAGGALAVFVVLYFWSPAHWQKSPDDGSLHQYTAGQASPAQHGFFNFSTSK